MLVRLQLYVQSTEYRVEFQSQSTFTDRVQFQVRSTVAGKKYSYRYRVQYQVKNRCKDKVAGAGAGNTRVAGKEVQVRFKVPVQVQGTRGYLILIGFAGLIGRTVLPSGFGCLLTDGNLDKE